jgi:predicted phosphodiesterase
MKIAVMSDIHGFSIALQRVLDDIAREPGVDRIIVAGDLCESGPDPAGALAILAANGIAAIRGNTDRDLVEGSRSSDSARWTAEQLGPDGMATLRELQFSVRVTPPGGRPWDDDLLVVHANPFDEDGQIPPDASEAEVLALLGDTRAAVIAFGHVHIAYRRRVAGYQLIDISSVGNPKDRDLRSKWGLCTWDQDAGTWQTELRYVEYPLEETLEQMEASGMPDWKKVARKLVRASYKER